jgi:hypothetical protein
MLKNDKKMPFSSGTFLILSTIIHKTDVYATKNQQICLENKEFVDEGNHVI